MTEFTFSICSLSPGAEVSVKGRQEVNAWSHSESTVSAQLTACYSRLSHNIGHVIAVNKLLDMPYQTQILNSDWKCCDWFLFRFLFATKNEEQLLL